MTIPPPEPRPNGISKCPELLLVTLLFHIDTVALPLLEAALEMPPPASPALLPVILQPMIVKVALPPEPSLRTPPPKPEIEVMKPSRMVQFVRLKAE